MNRGIGAGVQVDHAQILADTYQGCFKLLCNDLICQQSNNEEPLLINVMPSKKKAPCIQDQEFKVEVCHCLATIIGLDSLLLGQYCQFPSNSVRLRVKGCGGIIKFHQTYTSQLRQYNPVWAESFVWPEGRYKVN
jgi:hypothetical protein